MKQILFTILLASTIGGADGYMWVSLLLVPISSVISWFVGRRQRNNDTIQKMQGTIDMLVQKNSELYAKIVEQNKMLTQQSDQIANLNKQLSEVRRENSELKTGQERISEENAGLKKQLDTIKKGK